jgi:division protein CdvB (Snf7/Vps24/ESCRT-III family)
LLCKIDVQIVKLDHILQEIKLIDDNFLKNRVLSINENNCQYSRSLSEDIAHSRRVIQISHLSKIALEILKNKLLKISNFEDIVIVLSPAIAVVKNIRASLIPYVPESEIELGIISELLGCILIDASQVGGYTINFKIANEEAVHLLNEASLTAEQSIKKIYPNIPNYQ